MWADFVSLTFHVLQPGRGIASLRARRAPGMKGRLAVPAIDQRGNIDAGGEIGRTAQDSPKIAA